MSEAKGKLVASLVVAGFMASALQAAKADQVLMEVTRSSTPDSSVSTVKTTTTQTTTTTDNGPSTILTTPGTVVTTTTPTSTVVVSGNAVPLTIGEAQAILQTVEFRRAALDKQIVDARTAGTLSEAQAASYRREMDRIGAELVFLKGQPNPSLLRSIVLGQDLDALAVSLHGVVTTVTVIPIIEGSHFTVFNGRIVQLDDLAVRRIELENKILRSQAAGRTNYDEADHMRSELNAIAAIEDGYRVNGQIDFKSSREIYRDMDKVAGELDRAAH